MATTMCSVAMSTMASMQIRRIEWAEKFLVTEGIVKRRTKLKRLSAKTIAKIIREWHDAQERYYYRDDSDYDREY